MKSRKVMTCVLLIMMVVSWFGASGFADETVPATEDPATAAEEPVGEPVEEPEAEPVAEPEVGYLRFDLEEDLVFSIEDGVIVGVTSELNFHAEEPTEPTEPVEDPVEPEDPATEPEDPATEPADPATEPADPATEPADPATEPTDPATEPTDPATEPADPATEPADPATEPADPATEPADPATEPVDPYAAYLGLPVAEGIDLLLAGTEVEGPISLDIFADGVTAEAVKALLEEGYGDLLKLNAVALDSENPNAERFVNAAIYRITPGKMNLLEKLGAYFDESEIDYAAWSVLSVKEIQSMTKMKPAQAPTAAKEKVKTNNGKAKTKNK